MNCLNISHNPKNPRKVHSILAGYLKLDGGAMFGVVPKSIWAKKYPSDENNLCYWSMRCLLLEYEKKIILIDTGMGDKESEKFNSYYSPKGDTLLEALKKKGFQKEDITDVFLTHLHFDHVGGATIRLNNTIVTTFPNAKYWIHPQQWELAMNPNPREKASFLKDNLNPLADSGQLYFYDTKNDLPFDTITVNGHTKGQLLPLIQRVSKKILFAADLFPTAGHIKPAYVPAYDTSPLISMEEKDEILVYCTRNNILIFLEHDPYFEAIEIELKENRPIIKTYHEHFTH